jgi:hypothetical protein
MQIPHPHCVGYIDATELWKIWIDSPFCALWNDVWHVSVSLKFHDQIGQNYARSSLQGSQPWNHCTGWLVIVCNNSGYIVYFNCCISECFTSALYQILVAQNHLYYRHCTIIYIQYQFVMSLQHSGSGVHIHCITFDLIATRHKQLQFNQCLEL